MALLTTVSELAQKLGTTHLMILGSYLVVVINGMKSPLQNLVSKDITEAILKTHVSTGKCSQQATYWSHDKQKVRLEEAYQKYVNIGGVWSAAAVDVSNF